MLFIAQGEISQIQNPKYVKHEAAYLGEESWLSQTYFISTMNRCADKQLL